ncbi:TrkH family potassium uptake protein [Facklamia miroungae]|uniref:Trk system potassium uptake protein TrkH n=1 Tax=Facklamia miroungae TaxID=120956 RepID=A0A1G7T0J7_9LACT|nr:TrkH family potassium uptake protein [Facklamia miroungae]SDG28866.1 trk system potassium uptake protein TrkH [Facklamia miroungae]
MFNRVQNFFTQISAPIYIVLMFVLISFIGGLLLATPLASQSGQWTKLIDAWFTAVSAVCVTGNVTVNTTEHWNYIGRTIILILIEIGGLGFMTLWVTLFIYMGKQINLRLHKVLLESLNISDISEVRDLLRYIIQFSLIVQISGAVILGIDFIPRFGWLKGIYYSVFHSISAFCNAGFDLLGDSLVGFQDNPLVLITCIVLIIIGGLGFIVWRDLLTFNRNQKLLWHTKIVLMITIVLLIGGTILFAITEQDSVLFQNQSGLMKGINYLFLAVTPRTAGYSNIDYTLLSPAGIFLTIVLMFIGASSGSTGGGIKTTTLATLLIFSSSAIHRKGRIIFKRAIPDGAILKAVFILISGMVLITFATMILLITETIPPGFGIEYIVVEVVSCFSTVGLSMGLTPNLTPIGKTVLMFMMLIGRIGLLTVFWSANMGRKPSKIKYPQGNLMIG